MAAWLWDVAVGMLKSSLIENFWGNPLEEGGLFYRLFSDLILKEMRDEIEAIFLSFLVVCLHSWGLLINVLFWKIFVSHRFILELLEAV